MGIGAETGQFTAAEFVCPVNDVFNTQQKQQWCGLNQNDPQIGKAGQGIDPHLGHQNTPKTLAVCHSVSFRRLDLGSWYRMHCAKQHIAGESAKHDRKCKHRQGKPIDFMHPLRGVPLWQFCRLTDDKIGTLANVIGPVGAERFMACPFERLIQRNDEKQKENNVGDTAHNRNIDFTKPPQRRKLRTRSAGTSKAKHQRRRRSNRQQQQDRRK